MANVSTIHPSLQSDLKIYDFINDLLGGYDGVKSKGDTYLPKQLSEKNDSKVYDLRHSIATYLDSFNPVVNGINGLIFQKPITFDTTDTDLEDFINYATIENKNFNFFIKKYFHSALAKGRSYAYVDIPQGNENYSTDVQRRQAGIKPFVAMIRADQIINFRTERINGVEKPIMVVIKESVEVELNEWESEIQLQFRVLKVGSVEVYNKSYELVSINETGLDYIPIVELNLDENGSLFDARPPFLDVGRLSIDNYQLMSDSRWSANTASIPFLALLGFDEEEAKAVNISVNSGIRSSNEDAKVSYVDYEGKGVELNLKLMEVINKRINEIGMSVLTGEQTQITATEKTIDTIQTQSKVQTWVDSLKDSLYMILEYVAKYYNREPKVEIDITADILTQPLTAQEMIAYLSLADKNKISTETLLILLKDRKVLKEDFDIEAELDKLQDENTPFKTMDLVE